MLNQGGLARPCLSNEAEELPFLDLQGYPPLGLLWLEEFPLGRYAPDLLRVLT